MLMTNKISLAQYVRYRNGVPLGASGSLRNMLYRSLGATSFKQFWQYWNPIWGYYLSYYIYQPLKRYCSTGLATVFTFTISGALHDLAAILIKQTWLFICTPWFFLMGATLVTTQHLRFSYRQFSWPVRAAINLSFVAFCLLFVLVINNL